MGNCGIYGLRRMATLMGGSGPTIWGAAAAPSDNTASGFEATREGSLILAHDNSITYIDDNGKYQQQTMD